jgi:IclR family transcriptional regulator, KDG regulon repressor
MGEDKHTRSVERTLQILNAFTADRQALGLTELSRTLGLSKATVLRLVSTLCAYGFLRQDEDSRKYSLGLRLFALGGIVSSSFVLRNIASPHLRRLGEKLDKTVFLAVLEGDQMLYVDKKEAPGSPVTFNSTVGAYRPPHFGPLGHVLMAYLPEEEIDGILGKSPLVAFARKTITNTRDFKEELRRIRDRGYCTEYETAFVGIGIAAAPVLDATGSVVAAVGVGFMASAVSASQARKIQESVLETASLISREQGYSEMV